jgi:hypothetical protein
MILLEAMLLGVLGTLLGLALGVLLGRGAVGLVTQTVNDLFFVVSVREIDIPLFTLVKGRRYRRGGGAASARPSRRGRRPAYRRPVRSNAATSKIAHANCCPG